MARAPSESAGVGPAYSLVLHVIRSGRRCDLRHVPRATVNRRAGRVARTSKSARLEDVQSVVDQSNGPSGFRSTGQPVDRDCGTIPVHRFTGSPDFESSRRVPACIRIVLPFTTCCALLRDASFTKAEWLETIDACRNRLWVGCDGRNGCSSRRFFTAGPGW